jgi:hypothetical protein
MKLIRFIFNNFWTFAGFTFILYLAGNFIYNLYNRTLRHFILKRHGYQSHCDAEGRYCDGEGSFDPGNIKELDLKLNFDDKMKKQKN